MQIYTTIALLITAAQASTSSQPCTRFSPDPVPFSQLPTFFPRQRNTDVASLLDKDEIRETLSLYTHIIDGRAYASLSDVFAADAVANYSAPLGIMNGSEAIETTLSAALAQFAGTQHLLGSQRIRLCDRSRAISVSYFQATHFLQQNGTVGAAGVVDDSAVLYAYAQYQDEWVKRDGLWKIKHRNLVYMGPLVTDLS